MTLQTHVLDAGPEGTAITPSNSSILVSTGGGGTVVFAAAAAYYGSFGATIHTNSGGIQVLRWAPHPTDGNGTTVGPTTYAFRVPAGFVTTPINEQIFLQFRAVSGAHWSIRHAATSGSVYDDIVARDSTGAAMGTLVTNAAPGVKREFTGEVNETTGAFTIRAYEGAGNTLVGSITGTGTFANTGLATVQTGAFSPLAQANDFYTDAPLIDGGRTTEIPRPGAGGAVVVLRPASANGTGTGVWTSVGGANHGVTLADETDASLIRSADLTATPTTVKIAFVAGLPDAGAQSLAIRARKTDALAPAALTVTLEQGTTVRKTWPVTLTDTFQTFALPLTTTEVDTIRASTPTTLTLGLSART